MTPEPQKVDGRRGPKPNTPGHKRRGRPPKKPIAPGDEPETPPPKRKVGRPRKEIQKDAESQRNVIEELEGNEPRRQTEVLAAQGDQQRLEAHSPNNGERRVARSYHSRKRPIYDLTDDDIPEASWHAHTDERLPPPPSDCHILSEREIDQKQQNFGSQCHRLLPEEIMMIGWKSRTDEWHDLWKMTLHIFGKSPHDLFTWGLYESNAPNARLYNELCRILPHPFWQNDLSRLRYGLQKAICLRVQGHVEPLGPLRQNIAEIALKQTINRSQLALDLCKATRLDADQIGGHFIRLLQDHVKAQPRHWNSQEEDDDVFFYLKSQDVLAVGHVLDQLAISNHSSPFFSSPVLSYYKGYTNGTKDIWNTLVPTTKDTLERWEQWEAKRVLGYPRKLEPDLPADEKDTYVSLGYWDSPLCDPRFKQTIFPSSSNDTNVTTNEADL
jgi:hypothetical protein